MKIPFKSEVILLDTYRAKVIGGWIVNCSRGEEGEEALTESLVFIPDQTHEWEIS